MSRRSLWLIAVACLLLAGLALLFWLRGAESTRLLTRLFTRQDATWSDMQARKTWRVGMDASFPPFEDLDDGGLIVGYDVDLAKAIAEDWGLQLEIVPIGYDSLVDALRAGRIDSVVSALAYDARVTRDIAFSAAYFEAGVRLVARAGSPITSTTSLQGEVVAVEWGSIGDMMGRRMQREGIALEMRPYETPHEAVAGLLNDPTIDALLIDQVTLRQAQGQGATLVVIGPALESNPYVIAMPLRAYDLHEHIAATLERFVADGTLAALATRWFGPLPEGVDP